MNDAPPPANTPVSQPTSTPQAAPQSAPKTTAPAAAVEPVQAPLTPPSKPSVATPPQQNKPTPISEKTTKPAPTLDPPKDATFSASVRDAYALLDFSTRRGMSIPAHITTTIVQAHDKILADEKLPIDEQTAFWAAFREIIELVKPVTVESILFSAPKTDTPSSQTWRAWLFHPASPADRVLKRYLLLSLMSLFLLLGLQMEWAIGISTYNDAYKVHTYLTNTTDLLEDAKLKAKTEPTGTQDGASTSTLALQSTNAQTIQKLERQHKMDQSWDDVSYVRLWWWNRQIAQLFPPYDLSLSEKGPRFEAGEVILDKEGKRRIEFTRAELTLEIISNYVLVTLFALLGAMTQALRTLAEEIRTVSLTQTKLYSIRTRIILGVISGVCMAWLLLNSDPTNGGETSTLSTTPLNAISFLGAFTPWAIAFISGYSVEIFFSALERAIRTITKYIGNAPDPLENAEKKAAQPSTTPAPTSQPTPTQTPMPKSSPVTQTSEVKPSS